MYYALHYLDNLVLFTEPVSTTDKSVESIPYQCLRLDMIVSPQLELPDVFALLHLANQVSSLLIVEGVVGKCGHCHASFNCFCVTICYWSKSTS